MYFYYKLYFKKLTKKYAMKNSATFYSLTKLFLLISLSLAISKLNAQYQIGQDIDGEAAYDQSGISVSLSADGNTVAIGAHWNDGNGDDAGHVRVYQNLSGTWQQIGQDIDGEAAEDASGISVSLSADGNTVAIGAVENDGNGDDAGHVRVYQNQSGTWQQIGQDIDGEASGDHSGFSVSLSADGQILAIGAYYNDGNGSSAGHVRVYQNQSGTWQQIGQDIDGEASGDHSGFSVSLSADGQILAIGAPQNDGNGTDAGHVRVYQNISGTWQQLGQDIDGEAAGDGSGRSVSLSADGQIVAIGAWANDGNGNLSGHVRVYQNISGTWQQIGQDIDGEASGDLSGYSVSLSSDGQIVAIGAFRNDGNGADAGHVRVYQNIAGTWQQIGQDIDGESAGDWSGTSVSLSADGHSVAIGAYANDGNGSAAGHVRVYDLSSCVISIEEHLRQDHFVTIYPKPARDIIVVKSEREKIESIELFDITGNSLEQYQVNKTEIELNIQTLNTGVFYIKITTKEGSVIEKLIKE
jgi:Flp pilus assembly pilin Flp